MSVEPENARSTQPDPESRQNDLGPDNPPELPENVGFDGRPMKRVGSKFDGCGTSGAIGGC